MSSQAYRYVDKRYASMDEDAGPGPLVVEIETFDVLKTTPKGFWVGFSWGDWRRFIRNDAKKKFAHLTLSHALASFVARKKRQAAIYEARLSDAKLALRIAQEMTEVSEAMMTQKA